jgi:hypothetical protein
MINSLYEDMQRNPKKGKVQAVARSKKETHKQMLGILEGHTAQSRLGSVDLEVEE